MRVSRRAPVRLALLLAGVVVVGPAVAADVTDADYSEAEDLPDGFLEFLGMMVEQDGELIDPLSFSERMRPQERDSSEATQEKLEPEQSRNRDSAAAQEYPDEK